MNIFPTFTKEPIMYILGWIGAWIIIWALGKATGHEMKELIS